jgi:hypothetical protein
MFAIKKLAHALQTRKSLLPAPEPAQHLSNYLWLASALYFLGIYSDIGMRIGDTAVIPMVSAFPGLIMLLLVKGVVSPRLVSFVRWPFLFVVVCGVLAPKLGVMYANRLLGAGQAALSAGMAYVACWTLSRLGRTRIHRFLSIAIPIFLVLIAIELAVPQMRQVQTAFARIYGYGADYDWEALSNREATMGGYRPKLFTSEASYVGTSAMLMLIGYVWTGQGIRRYLHAAGYFCVAAILIRSPIVLLSLPPIVSAVYTDKSLGRRRSTYSFWMTIIAVILGALILLLGPALLADRLNNVTTGADYSTTYRTYGAVAVAVNTLKQYPLFGVGAGSIAIIKNTIISTYLSFGVPLSAAETDWRANLNNSYAAILVYFGFVGASVIILVVWRMFLNDVKKPRLPVALAFFLYGITFGAVYSPKAMITFTVIIAAAKLRANYPAVATSARRPPARDLAASRATVLQPGRMRNDAA